MEELINNVIEFCSVLPSKYVQESVKNIISYLGYIYPGM